jgi:hypothetical protein
LAGRWFWGLLHRLGRRFASGHYKEPRLRGVPVANGGPLRGPGLRRPAPAP